MPTPETDPSTFAAQAQEVKYGIANLAEKADYKVAALERQLAEVIAIGELLEANLCAARQEIDAVRALCANREYQPEIREVLAALDAAASKSQRPGTP